MKSGNAAVREVQLETLLEVCRWDLDLAEALAASWDGDPTSIGRDIEEIGKAQSKVQAVFARVTRPPSTRPDESHADLWEDGHIDLWQHECWPNPYCLLNVPGGIEHAVWTAQARVLLPWIEVRRQLLVRQLLERYGEDAIQRVAVTLNGSGRMPLEVGPLFLITRHLVPRKETTLHEAARQLMSGRNRLAHLQSLSAADQERLVRACSVLES